MPAHWWGAPGNYGKTASPDITCTGNATGCNHTCTGGGGGGGGIGGASAVTVRSVNYNVQQDSPPGLDDMDNGVASSTTTPVQVLQQPPSPTEIQAAGGAILTGVAAADELFASDEHYLLGRWVSAAKAMGANDDEKKLMEFNARTQITMWGPPLFSENKQHTAIEPGSPQDYAGKAWGGLFKDFYLPRQRLLIECAVDAAHRALTSGTAIDMDAFATNFTNLTIHRETAWGHSSTGSSFPTETVGDTFEIAGRLSSVYGGLVDSKTWCEVRDAGGRSYHSDKAGVTHYFVLQEVVPWLEASWEKSDVYSSVIRCV